MYAATLMSFAKSKRKKMQQAPHMIQAHSKGIPRSPRVQNALSQPSADVKLIEAKFNGHILAGYRYLFTMSAGFHNEGEMRV